MALLAVVLVAAGVVLVVAGVRGSVDELWTALKGAAGNGTAAIARHA